MNLDKFKNLVDNFPDEITPLKSDLAALYTYVGLPIESSFSQRDVADELYRKISAAFRCGGSVVSFATN
jgi:hypothetical protein